MTKKKIYRILEDLAKKEPGLRTEIFELVVKVRQHNSSQVDDALLYEWLHAYPRIEFCFAEHLQLNEEALSAHEPEPSGKVFRVYKPFSSVIQARLMLAEVNDHYRNWADAVKNIPKFTLPLPEVDGNFIRSAKEIWQQNIFGNEDVLDALLRHSIEYSQTGKTSSVLLNGPPGIGKTLAAKLYARILGLPGSFLSGPSASSGRGLSGAPNLYTGAGVGAIAQAMIDHKAGNPVICIDEIEKAGRSYGSGPDFQNELLSVLDDSNSAWRDNFLEMDIDASHIPFIFTSNEKELISAPLLDRMEVIEMTGPTLEMLQSITWKFTLPKAMKFYPEDRIAFEQHEVELLVELLWKNGYQSCRSYQRNVESLVSDAYLKAVETGTFVRVTEQNVKKCVERYACGSRKRIGF